MCVAANADTPGSVSRQLNQESGAATIRLGQGDSPAVKIDEVFDNGEAEAGAVESADRALFSLEEPLEDRVAKFDGNARPGIGDLQIDPFCLRAAARVQLACHAPVRRRELEGIGQQVQHNPHDLVGIDFRVQTCRSRDVICDLALLGDIVEIRRRLSNESSDIEIDVARLQPARIEACHVQQIVDMPEQRACVPPDHTQRRRPGAGHVRRRQHLFDGPENERERRAQLVADVREELRLELIEPVKPLG